MSIEKQIDRALDAGGGVLRLAPAWVPRSFLVPGRRLRLHPDDYYALGAHRGGIDERWLASTTEADNEDRLPDEGLSYIVNGGDRFTLRDAVSAAGARIIGKAMWEKYKRWPVLCKLFDNLGPIPHHLHQSDEQAKLIGQEGKPEGYYFPRQYNQTLNTFPLTYFGIEPGTTKKEVRRCLERWNEGDNGILDLSKAYRIKLGSGWLVPPCILHAPSSCVTYEPQWGSDVFGLWQNMVDGRFVPWELLVKSVPDDRKKDLDFLVGQLDWEGNTDTHFKDNHYLEPIPVADTEKEGWVDRWIVYGAIGGKQLFSARELTVRPGAKCAIKDAGASGVITVQGQGRLNKLRLSSPEMIRFGQRTEDEVFISHEAATAGLEFENTGAEPLVTLRHFGPDVHKSTPQVGDHKKLHGSG